MRDFFIFAGPNGSGKSTIIEYFLSNNDLIYLNADYCARADPEIAKMQDGQEKSIRAQKKTENLLKGMIEEGLSFAWETVFSHESRLEIMKFSKQKGYRIHLFYITTKHPDINVARVHDRFLQGGHDVPEDKIRGRYERSVSFLPQMILIADEVLVYDNSYEKTDPQLLFQKLMENEQNNEPEMIVWQNEDDEISEWVLKYIVEPLSDSGYFIQCYI